VREGAALRYTDARHPSTGKLIATFSFSPKKQEHSHCHRPRRTSGLLVASADL
jgi:hypothetical protein